MVYISSLATADVFSTVCSFDSEWDVYTVTSPISVPSHAVLYFMLRYIEYSSPQHRSRRVKRTRFDDPRETSDPAGQVMSFSLSYEYVLIIRSWLCLSVMTVLTRGYMLCSKFVSETVPVA